MIYFLGDTHFNHKNIAGPELSSWDRGYRNFSSITQMNDTIIDSINNVVQEDDILYHLGDFAFGNKKEIPELRDRIKCKTIYLIYGNHDHALRKYYQSSFTRCYHEIPELFYKSYHFHLYHYPISSWNGIGNGSIQIHGHCHGTFKGLPRQLDVGYDCFKEPVSIDWIIDHMKDKDIVCVDHHNKGTPIR